MDRKDRCKIKRKALKKRQFKALVEDTDEKAKNQLRDCPQILGMGALGAFGSQLEAGKPQFHSPLPATSFFQTLSDFGASSSASSDFSRGRHDFLASEGIKIKFYYQRGIFLSWGKPVAGIQSLDASNSAA